MRFYYILKRFVDIVVSFIGLIILIPIFLFLVIFIKLTSKGPVVYRHIRIGKDEKKFIVYKFRSMVVDAREQQKKGVSDEQLITRAGKFMRKTFLDELLQLLNVLKGDISLIGPRPFDEETYNSLIKKEPGWKIIFKTKPGMTCIDSIIEYVAPKQKNSFVKLFKGISKKAVEMLPSYKQGYLLSKYYVEKESLVLDVKLFFYTLFLMLRKIFSRK